MNETTLQPQETLSGAEEIQAPFFSRIKHSMRKGVSDASKAVDKSLTTACQIGAKAVYGICYGISYGATFAALGVARVLPEAMLRGFKDGAQAAEETLTGNAETPSESEAQPA
jgi:hypothetical protein